MYVFRSGGSLMLAQLGDSETMTIVIKPLINFQSHDLQKQFASIDFVQINFAILNKELNHDSKITLCTHH
jgi:hypothetical protein